MPYIKRDGKVYLQTISEIEVDLGAEEYTLQAYKDAIIVDAREEQERQAKFQEIEATNLDEKLKEQVKAQLIFSGSGITQDLVNEQQAKITEIKRVNGDKL